MEANSRQDFELHRSMQPYIGMMVIYLAVTVFFLYSFFRKPESSLIWTILFGWLLFGVAILMARTYRISLKSGVIVQRGLGVKTISIPVNQIEHIELEVSLGARRKTTSFFFVVDRPFRRIVITPKDDHDNYIDVSLKHFAAEDIRALMRRIREQRPDLSFPQNWI